MEVIYDINAYESNQIIIYAVQGESNSRTVTFNIIEKSGIISATSNAKVINKMLDLTDYTAQLFVTRSDDSVVSCEGEIISAENGMVKFVLTADITAIKGTGSGVIVLSNDSSNLRIVGITISVQQSSTENTVISVARGSSYSFSICIVDNDSYYKLITNDILRFGVKKRDDDTEYLISKTATSADSDGDNGYIFNLECDDTVNLTTGNYVYDVGLQFANGDFKQIIPTSLFKIKSAITAKE